ncbi:hypothetical protein [Streptomyces sp. NPDC047453]
MGGGGPRSAQLPRGAGEGPSVRQLAQAIGLRSTASVAYHLANLERSAR